MDLLILRSIKQTQYSPLMEKKISHYGTKAHVYFKPEPILGQYESVAVHTSWVSLDTFLLVWALIVSILEEYQQNQQNQQ